MDSRYMVLDSGHNVVPSDLTAWAQFFDKKDARRVGYDNVGDYRISTVFLGVDHSYGDGPPLWFETMIFGEDHDQECWRYTTWAEAEAGHERIVTALREGREP